MDTNRLPKVAITCTEDGHKQTTKCGYKMYRGWTQIEYQKWLQHVQRMDTNRLPKVATACTEDGHKQTTKSGYNMCRGWKQTDYQKWLQHVQRMDTHRIPKQALQYQPKGRRNIGWLRKIWREQLHLEYQGTGNTPNPSWTWWWWWYKCCCVHPCFKLYCIRLHYLTWLCYEAICSVILLVQTTMWQKHWLVNWIIRGINEREPTDCSKWYSNKLGDRAIPSDIFGTNIAALPVAHFLFHNSCTSTQCTIFNSPIFL